MTVTENGVFITYTMLLLFGSDIFNDNYFVRSIDGGKQCLIKDSEVILVPELGARLGNFTVTEISNMEFWLLTAEWVQPLGCEKYGSNNAIWIAKICFSGDD